MTELSDLTGKHILTGVDESHAAITHYGSLADCQVINFILDGVTYTATENPSDGYRSMLGELVVSTVQISNIFQPVEAVGTLRTVGNYGGAAEILELRDTVNGKLVLEVGTDNSDDYYPSFVASFSPENMHVNDKVQP